MAGYVSPCVVPAVKMPTAEQRARDNANRRAKYASSEEWRDRKAAQYQAWKEKSAEAYNAVRRQRRLDDPEYREHCNALRRGRDQREYQLKIKYGISLAQYNAMHGAQGGACAICRRDDGGTLHVDHCHATNRVRGLLCSKCNAGLGCYGDDEELMLKAIEYLRGSR